MQSKKPRADLWMDLGVVIFLVIFDVATRLMPHPPGVTAVAASAFFAGRTLRIPALAVVVPLLAMALSGAVLASDDGRISLVVYAAITVPAFAGMLARRRHGVVPVVAATISCSLIFFAASNFAVWAFSGMYPLNVQGLAQCYAAALPFLDKTVLGDLIWTAVLFGGAWLVQCAPAMARRAS